MTQPAAAEVTSLYLRNIPSEIKEEAEFAAKRKGFNSLSEYVRNEIRLLAEGQRE